MTEATLLPFDLPAVRRKKLTVDCDGGSQSSDGGLLLLREAERSVGICARLAGSLTDRRDPSRIEHSLVEMIKTRALAICCGYEDGNDLDRLRGDPLLKLAVGRCPESGADLCSQSTMSRLENMPSRRQAVRMTAALIDQFCASFPAPPAEITLDIDDTLDIVHGQQELALFNTHAGGYCFQPIVIFEGNSGKPIVSLLRPGKRPAGEEIARVLWHVIHRIRRHWPNVRILVRGDGHYCAPEVLNLLRRLRCDYILGLPINVKLDAIAKPWREQCERRREAGRSKKARRMHQLTYQAGSWSQGEKVIARVEATEMGSDARFVVTNLAGRGKVLYEKVYCARGRMENMIKDMKLYTRSDKTACSRWQANQFRLFLHMGAYWLLHSVRMAAPKRSRWRGATFATIRSVFVKIACRVEELKTRIKLSFPAHLPHADALATVTARLCAQGP